MNGLLSGMVASCSGCNVYAPWAAILVGIGGAFSFFFQNWLFEYILHIDDPLGAAALHMGAGTFGLLMVGFFADSQFTTDDHVGIFYGGNGKQLGWQLAAFCVYFFWSFGTCSLIFYPLKRFGMLRVSEEVERMGMDTHHHGGAAYRRSSALVLDPVEESRSNGKIVNIQVEEQNSEEDVIPSPSIDIDSSGDGPLSGSLRRRKQRTMSIRRGAD
jgi:ammonia channel protein AmtB